MWYVLTIFSLFRRRAENWASTLLETDKIREKLLDKLDNLSKPLLLVGRGKLDVFECR